MYHGWWHASVAAAAGEQAKWTRLLYGTIVQNDPVLIKNIQKSTFSCFYTCADKGKNKCGVVTCQYQVAKISDIFPKSQSVLPPDIEVWHSALIVE